MGSRRPVITVRLAGPGDATVLAEMRYAFRSEMAVPTEPETPLASGRAEAPR
jgi:hypothetical protein